MCRPSRRGNKLSACNRLVHCNCFVFTAGSRNLRAHGRVATARFSLKHPGRNQNLGAVAYAGDRLIEIGKMTYQFQNTRVEPQVLRRTASGNHERVVIFGPNFVKRGV
jgi:hypothetical protein